MSRKKDSSKVRLSKDKACLEVTDIKLPIRVEIVPKTKPRVESSNHKPPPSRIPVWVGRKANAPKSPKTVSQHRGPNDCLRNSFQSTPSLESGLKHSVKSYLRSTPNLEIIDERKPLSTAKPRKGTCRKSQSPKPCPPKPKQSIRKVASVCREQVHASGSHYLQSELGSAFLFPNTHCKLSPFCSTPSLGVKNRCTSLGKLLASSTIISKKERPKSGKKNPFKSKSLIDRSSLTQKQYMDLLSTPQRPQVAKPQQTNSCRKFDSCPPRIVQIAAPTKRLVLANWKDYQNVYSAEQLERFDRILKSGGNELDVREARTYFESLDRKKRKSKAKKKCKCKDNSSEKKWVECQVSATVDAILAHFENEPLFMLNFTEMIMSDEILNWLERKKVIKISNRSTRNVYKRTVINFCDKVVTWMDKLNYIVDLQALDSREQLAFSANFSSESCTSEEEESDDEFDTESGKELVPLFSPSFNEGLEESGESSRGETASDENLKYESSFEYESSDEYVYDDASKPHLVEPLDFENFLLKNKTVLQNDPQRELLLYPPDDISEVVLPRRYRTLYQTFPTSEETENCNLFTKQCITSYSTNWNLIHYKYNAYSGSYADLPKIPNVEYKEENYEIDIDTDADDDKPSVDSITKEGYLMKGPEVGSERTFVNIGSKSFKRRYCSLRQEVDGTYILELYKDEKKGEAKVTIVMDFCTDVVKVGGQIFFYFDRFLRADLKCHRIRNGGRFGFELRMTAGHKSYLLAAENETDFKDWLCKLSSVLQQNKLQEEKRAASLERDRNTPPPSPQVQPYGTLKGLEQSMNPQLIKYARETDVSIAFSRKENRNKLFPLYPHLAANLKSPNSSQGQVEPFKEVFGHRVFLKCESIKFRLQAVDEKDNLCQVEPYHTTLCLFDAKNARKLTENFHFDVNSSCIRKTMFSGNGTDVKLELPQGLSQEWLFFPRQALMSITNPHPDIFLVVRIEKVLQGGICQSSEAYVKANKDPKISLKAYKNIATCCQRLGNYRMPFAWAVRPLFRLYSNELDNTSEFHAIYRQEPNKLTDEELLKLLTEYRKPDKFSKFTVIPGSLQIKIAAMNELPSNCLTTALVPLKPFPVPPSTEPTIEIAEFEASSEKDVHPYTTFVNHLYVYPLSLNFDTQKMFARARNIACMVELRDSDNEEARGLPCIYGRPGQSLLVSQASCAVLHHNTMPTWYEEVKIKLPINLLSTHHLLFVFYHISCDITKKRENGIENCVGYAWLPLLHRGKLNVEVQTVPVAAHLPPGYLAVHPFGLGKGNAGPEIVWIDGQKPIFTVGFNLYSTVNTKDQHLFNLFSHAERLLDPKPSALPSEIETCKVLKALHAIQLTTLITFLPTLLNHLFTLLVATNSEEIGLNIIRVLINLVNMVYEAGRREVLQAYVKYVFVSPVSKRSATVHEEMCKHLPVILHPNNTDFLVVNKFMHHGDFFFDVIIKAMAQHLLLSGRIKMHRHERFSTDYLQKIETLMQILIPYVLNKYKEMPVETKELNKSVAQFLKKCLSLMDRGFVFRLINLYMDKFNPGDPRVLQEYKFAFLEIICNHEHYVAFNLPIQHNKLSPKNRSPDNLQEFTLSEEFCKHHFVVALLLQEIKTSLNEVTPIRRIALNTLRDLLAKHELDDRYQNKGQLSRIALIYMPWLAIVLENLNRLDVGERSDGHDSIANRISSSSSYMFGKSSAASDATPRSHRFTLHIDKDSPMHIRNSAFFEAIAGQINGNSLSIDSDISAISGDAQSTASQDTTIIRDEVLRNGDAKASHTRTTSHVQRYDKLQQHEVKDVLLIFLFVVKYIGEDQLITWWQQYSDGDVTNFFTVLEMCLHCFKYVGERNVTVVKSLTVDSVKSNPKKAHTLPARMNPAEINHENTSTLVIHMANRENLVSAENEVLKKQQAVLEQHLATEVGMITLDAMGLYCMNFRKNLLVGDGENDVMRKIFDIYLSFMQIGQSEALFKHVFAALRAFINNYSAVLFQGNAVLCGRLCYELLKCCNSRLSSVRQESCAILYLLMRSNFEFTNRKGLTRVHLQVIISVSQMLGSIVGLNNARFQESLSMINSYASSDKAMKGTGFPVEVKDLTKRIRTVLMATLQMREHHHDPEMLVDLQHSLANSYASTPELRHTWLETMTRNHVRDGNFSEATCCQLHIAALMAEYLKLKRIQPWGAEVFEKISSNISRDEKGLKLDAGVQDVQYTEIVLLDQLETCAEYVDKSERYEIMGELYKLIVPIYEKARNYEMLMKSYQTLAQNYEKVLQANKSGRRLLGRYYRVGFYGQYFEEDSGVEYVYKEPKVTSLSEISERLQKQYCDKFGQDVVKMIQDSTPVNASELDAKLAYIQVTHVTPYLEKTDLEDRQNEFEQNHDINTFMFETPFTKDGKARGNPEEQWKRRTILKTEYSFPYVKKRIKVSSKRTVELSPIEVAINEMQIRVQELEDVVFTEPTDAKKLQLLLQGSVCVQVNAGPLAYASVFLDPALCNMYPEDKVEELKDIYREFLKICYSALQVNGKLISQDQYEYQEVLRQNYKKLCTSLSNLFGESLWPHDETGSFKRNSMALFSAISGASQNSSTA
ncbi:Dedicator of cytokinesis protein 11-like Protein [Tribolium castaneum]|uniref:Dedicator of cytokinesis protein 11-like Protein n=1 Tax=Tribolium castaneum TaxID=7070 RepID=D6WLQ6_TRICA|nr:Dedicator of cytokinesis protein 11-like Protein [Tribolium castaneum]